MKTSTRFLVAFAAAWLAGAAITAASIWEYSPEDFTLFDLVMFGSMLGLGGLILCGAVAFPALIILGRKINVTQTTFVSPLASALLITSIVAAVSGIRAFVFRNLPVEEAVLFTFVFFAMSLVFGWMYSVNCGETCAKKDSLFRGIAGGLILAVVGFTPRIIASTGEFLQADERNGRVDLAGKMLAPRSAHTATLLPDGRILLAGGMVSVTGEEVLAASAELYDPKTGRSTPTGDMSVARAGHTATLLSHGDVLLTGGGVTSSAELYQPATGRFISAGNLNVERERHAATLLKNGKVLITGGSVSSPSAVAELFDPTTRTFRTTGEMKSPRAAHTATLLTDGRVLIAGGRSSAGAVLASAEMYDPESNIFVAAGNMSSKRYKHSATLLHDGKVLIAGGSDERDWNGQRRSAEIFDPDTNKFTAASGMHRPRFKFTGAVTASRDGKVVVAGAGRRVEIYDPSRGRFSVGGGSLERAWYYAASATLRDGRVLISGGYDQHMNNSAGIWIFKSAGPLSQSAELAHPAAWR